MEEVKLKILDGSRKRQIDTPVVVQAKGRVVFNEDVHQKLNVRADDFVLFAELGDNWYVARKPEGYFGYKLRGKERSRQLFVSSKSLEAIPMGGYNLGDPVLQDNVYWFPFRKVS